MWREFKGYSDCGPPWLFRLEFHSEMLPESGVTSQPLPELRRWGGADSWPKLEAVAALALFSAPFYLTVRNLPSFQKSENPCTGILHVVFNSETYKQTDVPTHKQMNNHTLLLPPAWWTGDRRAGWWLWVVVLPLNVAGELHLAMPEKKFSWEKYLMCADLQKSLPICTDFFFF